MSKHHSLIGPQSVTPVQLNESLQLGNSGLLNGLSKTPTLLSEWIFPLLLPLHLNERLCSDQWFGFRTKPHTITTHTENISLLTWFASWVAYLYLSRLEEICSCYGISHNSPEEAPYNFWVKRLNFILFSIWHCLNMEDVLLYLFSCSVVPLPIFRLQSRTNNYWTFCSSRLNFFLD